ncbi:MAG: thioredoxin family protein [Armatimonadetes bacterium]|nr:thioredoxin family protein [Armatimonadota bacterium]
MTNARIALPLLVAITLLTAGLPPAVAQDTPPDAAMTAAYQALQQAAQAQDLAAIRGQAEALLAAAARMDAATMTPDHLYMVGVAHYWLMGIVFETALGQEGLSPERRDFAQEMADLVLRGGQPEGVKVISHGERINLEEHLTEGMTTIVDFYSEYCPPCVAVAPVIENLVTSRSDLALVKVDINRPGHQGIDWTSPVSQQFNLRSIPYFRIYDADGQLMAEGQQAASILMRWVQEMK